MTWKISRGEFDTKKNFIIEVRDENHRAFGEVAFPTASPLEDSAHERFSKLLDEEVQSLEGLLQTGMPSPMMFGLTSAFTHLQAQLNNQSLAVYLGQKPRDKVPTSFSVPILNASAMKDYVENFNLERFKVLKLKISTANPVAPCIELWHQTRKPLRIDANQSFQSTNEVLRWLKKLKGLEIEFIEQPMPADKVDEYIQLKEESPYPIIGDESISDKIEPDLWQKQFHGVNFKLMKSGSYQNLLAQKQAAQKAGLKTMLGCMVETSLGISGALNLATDFDYYDLDSFLFFKKEPFGRVQENRGFISLT